ncbi:MAG: Rpn family recombination-promoting nuclease/putative transposase [Chloroflexota bacterium]
MAKSKSRKTEQHQQETQPSTDTEELSDDKNQAQNPHDHYFRHLFSRLDHVHEFLQGFLLPEIIALVVLKELTYAKDTYIDKNLANYENDLIFEVRLREVFGAEGDKNAPDTVEIYFLFEHKSYREESVLEQLLRYMALRWLFGRQQLRLQNRDKVIVFIDNFYGIFDLSAFLLLTHVPFYPPPDSPTLDDILTYYSISLE